VERCSAAIVVLALSLGGCASMQRAEWRVLAADPAPDAGFLAHPERLSAMPDRSAFGRMWTSRKTDWRRFGKLYVAPVDTSHRIDDSLWDSLNIRHGKVAWDRERQADELRDRVAEAFRDDPQKHFVVLDDPSQIDADTAVLELSLVELVPNKAVLGAIGLAAWGAPLEIGVPVATLTAFTARGSVAVEGDVRDAGTGNVVAMFADRETGKMRVIDLRSLTWYANAHETMDGWADALVELANEPRGGPPAHDSLFTFMPW
jgi:hypothetical protein